MSDGSDDARDLIAYQLGPSELPLVPAPRARSWMSNTDQNFANRCLPMLIANQSGWVLLNNRGFGAWWNGETRKEAISVAYEPSDAPPLAGSFFGYGILTWSIPFVFRTPPGYNLWVRGPVNSPKDGVSALEGVVESDWATSTFTMNWKITRPNTVIQFAAGEPICMIVPQRRGELEEFRPRILPFEEEPELAERHKAWSSSREEFLRGLVSGGEAREKRWQRDYFSGRNIDDDRRHPEHQNRLELSAFESGVESKRPLST